MKRFLLLFFLLLFFFGISFSQGSRYISGKNYEGYAFPKEHQIWGMPTTPDRYTLSDEEISEAELILKKNIKRYNQTFRILGKRVVIRYRLKKYYRQYLGYIDENGNRTVTIFLWFKKSYWGYDLKELSNDIPMVLGGSNLEGSFEVNLETKELKRDYDLIF